MLKFLELIREKESSDSKDFYKVMKQLVADFVSIEVAKIDEQFSMDTFDELELYELIYTIEEELGVRIRMKSF